MKRFTHLSGVSWLLMFAAMTVIAPPSRGQSVKAAQSGISPSKNSCPTISVSCPDDFKDGEPLIFTAIINGGDAGIIPSYNWSVSEGTIIEGQGTRTIKINIEGGWSHSSATVNVGGLDPTCAAIASCSLNIERPPAIEKFDSFGVLSIAKEKLRLEDFASALKNQPGAQGYVLSYGGRKGFAGEATVIGERVKAYLINERRIHADRIVTVEGGFREKLAVDLLVVPTGGVPPTPMPSVDPSEVTLIKLPARKARKHPTRR